MTAGALTVEGGIIPFRIAWAVVLVVLDRTAGRRGRPSPPRPPDPSRPPA